MKYYPHGVVAILVAGVVLRLSGITQAAIWYDESYSLHLVRLPMLEMVRTAAMDFNPPLWEIVLWFFVRAFGESEFILRLPSFIASCVSLYLAYRLTQEFHFGESQTLIALAFIAFLPYQIWMAQDGRMYALFGALYLGAIWFALRGGWLGLAACCGLMTYAHTTGLFFSASALLVTLLTQRSLKVFVSGAIVAASFGAWLPVMFNVTTLYFWLPALDFQQVIIAIYRAMFADALPGTFSLAGVLMVTVSGAVALWLTLWHGSPRVVLTALGPLALLLVASVLHKNIFFYRPVAPLIALLVLWMASLIPRRLTLINRAALIAWGVLLVVSISSWLPTSKSGDLRDLARTINTQWRAGDVIYHITATSYLPFSHYLIEDGVLMDAELHNALLQRRIQDVFNVPRGDLESLPHTRAWIVYARDPLLTTAAQARANKYTADATRIGTVRAFQFAEIDVYLVE